MNRARAVFLDRDGTLMEEVNYCGDPAQVRVFPSVPAALRKLKDAGFRLFIITNQSGIGRGYFTEDQYHSVQRELLSQIGQGLIDGEYFCPDVPGPESRRRKPEPAMVLEAAAEHALDLGGSVFVGDKADDVECGRRAGTKTILVMTGYGAQQECQPDARARDLAEAVELMLGWGMTDDKKRSSVPL